MTTTNWWESQSFKALLLFVAGLVANAVGKKFGVSLNTEEIVALATVVLGFFMKRGWESTATIKANVPPAPSAADALKDAAKP